MGFFVFVAIDITLKIKKPLVWIPVGHAGEAIAFVEPKGYF